MKSIQTIVSVKTLMSLLVFIGFAFLVLCGNTDRVLYYAIIAYSLAAIYLVLPVIWMKDTLKWRMQFSWFVALFCISWAIAFAMILLSSYNILTSLWLQWVLFAIAFIIMAALSAGYKYQS